MGLVFVFGHRNPDNDSICSAVAYAHLKNVTDPDEIYVPARLGPMPPETQWTFQRFGVDAPTELPHVRARVRDAMSAEVITIAPNETLLRAGELMRAHGVRALPVVGEERVASGLIDQGILAELYLKETELRGFEHMPMIVSELAEAVGGRVVCGQADMQLSGRVLIGAMEPETMRSYIHAGDTLIVGDRVRTQPLAIQAGAACLVISGGFEPETEAIDLADSRGAAIVSSPHDTYATARLVSLGRSVGAVMDRSPLLVDPEALLAEVAEDLIDGVHREAIVVDEQGRLLGILTRSNLARGVRRRVILLDHNEISQSAPGVEEASVMEIVDHHRVGDIQTTAPILFLNLPVGSTATIVADRYREQGVPIPDPIAGILLSAVLTDTVLLKSPTTTPLDHEVAERLARQLGLDAYEFGLEMFRARSRESRFSAEETVAQDVKEYRAGDAKIAIAQVETADVDEYLDHEGELLSSLEDYRLKHGLDLAMLLVTDVIRGGSEVFAAGKTRIASRALGVDLNGGPVWMEGVLSRKKQVASRLLESIGG